jgi:hypothetical protein
MSPSPALAVPAPLVSVARPWLAGLTRAEFAEGLRRLEAPERATFVIADGRVSGITDPGYWVS